MQFNAADGNAPTLNVNSLGATPLQYHSAGAWRAVPAGLWDADEIFRVAYNSSAGAYRLIGFRNRTGEVVPYAGATAPAGSLLCYGQAISRTAYVGLFTALGTAHGVGDGSTTFNLPDLRGRVAAGKDDMGGSAANRITAAGSGITCTTLGATGGAQSHSHSVSTVSVGMDFPNSTSGVNNGTDFQAATALHIHVGVQANGTAATTSNMPPTIILNYLIRI